LSIRPKRSLSRSISAVIAAALVASVLALVAGPASAVTPLNKSSATTADGRVSGTDRYGTATAAASAYLTRRGSLGTWNRIVVVSGDNFPDALSAASLAGSYTAPIILMPSDGSLPTVVKEWGLTKRDQIQANSTTAATFKLVIVGGTSAVPDAGVDALLAVLNAGDLTPATKTRISGANRAATAKAVATQTNAAGTYTILAGAKEIFVANEASFADAMAVAPYAFNGAVPVILTGKDSLGADALAVLKLYKALSGTKIKVLGGTAAVSDQVIQDIVTNAAIPLSSISRIFGADRYATSVAIQNYVDASSVNNARFDASHVVMVNGQNFADGLAAAPYVGHGTGGAARLMYLTEADAISASVSAKITAYSKVTGGDGSTSYPTNVYAVGGTSVVSASVIAGVTTAASSLNTTSTLTCVENSTATEVILTVPGNISGSSVAGFTYLGDEANIILNGSLTINGTSNTSSASTAMVETFSAVTGNTTLKGLVPAATLTKGYVITWSGLSEAANAAIADRTIAGSSCTVANDATGIGAVTIVAPVGATSIDVTFAEKVVGFDCGDVVATIAALPTGVPLGCEVSGPDAAGTTYRLDYFTDYNGNGSADGTGATLTITAVASGIFVLTSNTEYQIGDKVVVSAPAGGTCSTNAFVREGADATHMGIAPTWGGHGGVALATLSACTQTSGTIIRTSEVGNLVIAAADTFVLNPTLKFAPVVVASTAAISTAHKLGCTVTTSAVHGLVVGDIVDIAGLTTAGDNGSYEVDVLTSTTIFTVNMDAACSGTSGSDGTTSEAGGAIYDVSNNVGTATTTKTVNAVNDADATKPVLTASYKCTQGADATLSNSSTVKAVATNVYGPQGVAGNAYKMYVVNSRGVSLPSVVVDDTAKTITITADLAYTSISDVQASYANAGGIAWSFAHQTGSATVAIGTASATTAATPITSASGAGGDVVGAQTCSIYVTSNERLMSGLASADVTAVVAINGVATTIGSSGQFGVLNSNMTKLTSLGTIAPTTAVVAGTMTVTLTDSNSRLKDKKGNLVTVLALQG